MIYHELELNFYFDAIFNVIEIEKLLYKTKYNISILKFEYYLSYKLVLNFHIS